MVVVAAMSEKPVDALKSLTDAPKDTDRDDADAPAAGTHDTDEWWKP
jgi:hypothetical protein